MSEISIKQFITEELCKTIEYIKEKHPYFAFGLIATGIEFLGACMDSHQWNESGHSKTHFNSAISTFPTLQKYKSAKLYSTLRCGMCHILTPKPSIQLANGEGIYHTSDNIIYIDTFYREFKDACTYLLQHANLWGNCKKQNDVWWILTELPNPSSSTTKNDTHTRTKI